MRVRAEAGRSEGGVASWKEHSAEIGGKCWRDS